MSWSVFRLLLELVGYRSLRRAIFAGAVVCALALPLVTVAASRHGEGCGLGASTDPTILDAGRQVARCQPGAPAPQPLADRRRIVLTSISRSEFVAPYLLAESLGEFEKENIEFEFRRIGLTNALYLLASGDVDVAVGTPEAGFFNAVSQGLNVRWVLGSFFPPDAGDAKVAQDGLWARKSLFRDPANPDISQLKGATIGTSVGFTSVIMYPLGQSLGTVGIDLRKDVRMSKLPSADLLTALENGAIDAAWLLNPYWIRAAKSGEFILVATQTRGEPLSGAFFGPRLLEGDRQVGMAFVRAVVRSINTYFDGDYHRDLELMEHLSQVMGASLETLLAGPGLLFDWEIRRGTTDSIQRQFKDLGMVRYEPLLPDGKLVDRSFYLEAVGHQHGGPSR